MRTTRQDSQSASFFVTVSFPSESETEENVSRCNFSLLALHHCKVKGVFYDELNRKLMEEHNTGELASAYDPVKGFSPWILVDEPCVTDLVWNQTIESEIKSKSTQNIVFEKFEPMVTSYVDSKKNLSGWTSLEMTSDKDFSYIRSKVGPWIEDAVYPRVVRMMKERRCDVNINKRFVRLIYKIRQIVSPEGLLSYSCVLKI